MTDTTDATGRAALAEALGTYGADFSRWPDAIMAAAARRAVLADPGLRAAFDAEKALDALLDEARATGDCEIAASGALSRIRDKALSPLRADPLADLSWRRIAAALVLSAMVGSSTNLLFAESDTSTEDTTLTIAALAWPEDVETQ
jgi:hypothetical protein